MSIFLVKTLKIRGGWGLCPQTPLASGYWELRPHTSSWGTRFAEFWGRHWKNLWSFLPPPPKFWAGRATATGSKLLIKYKYVTMLVWDLTW